jgi:hypothetical protein
MNAIYTRQMSQKVDGDADVTKSTSSVRSEVLMGVPLGLLDTNALNTERRYHTA